MGSKENVQFEEILKRFRKDLFGEFSSKNRKEIAKNFRFIGSLVSLKKSNYYSSWYAAVDDSEYSLEVTIPHSIKEKSKVERNDEGTFIGTLELVGRYKFGEAHLRLSVKDIQVSKTKKSKPIKVNTFEFPVLDFQENWRVAVISSEGDGFKDAEAVLKSCEFIDYELFSCNLLEPEDIVAAIKRVDPSYHILLIVRGGGKGLGKFNDVRIVEAIQNHERYVVTGLGHTEDKTIADTVSCYCANVPADAARHIKNKCIQEREKKKNVIETPSVSEEKSATPTESGNSVHVVDDNQRDSNELYKTKIQGVYLPLLGALGVLIIFFIVKFFFNL
ncbi:MULTISPECIES: exodeoxyribonuclease VII large subunit [Priestia]|uniref:Exonuclease VII large subunit C-terminal domain-containing protein n=2 Tax=Priestia TaxID=2800373 RepID=D5DPN0_PRIM1|nr:MULTISPECIES: exodeoxyribonuclease VII large subunit [Priestia]ADE68951.1 hypothetical protein BMQ_1922 [Priestia megaterium QM B1551]MBA9038755.1 hypothetical protein [Priestia aryabhattai]MBG9930724.1 hypothetical protein [Priestia aryabhattai]MED4089500.1 exodeoxyribonuclease VII large subunit [Priestia megaterium]MUL30667.1 Exodeoxyribonuclease 7 large subunit [Priestia megaterium]